VKHVVRPQLAGQDRALLFGLGAGLFIGLLVGARRFAPIMAVLIGAMVVCGVYGALRITRSMRSRAAPAR
jgi:predicted ABC-type sugar transport system permease subunit